MSKLTEEIAALRVELAAFRAETKADLVEVKTDLRDHMKRTSLLEAFQQRWAGALLVLVVLASVGAVATAAIKVFEALR